jgi:hypothetical protein
VYPAQYLHVGPDTAWAILWRQPSILLYCPLEGRPATPGIVFFDTLFNELRRIVINMVARQQSEPDQSWCADIELRIPRSCISFDPFYQLLYRYDEDAEISKLIERLSDAYDVPEDDPGLVPRATWRIVFTDGPQYCPCCMVAVSPEAMAECRGETGLDKADEADWSLAFL